MVILSGLIPCPAIVGQGLLRFLLIDKGRVQWPSCTNGTLSLERTAVPNTENL